MAEKKTTAKTAPAPAVETVENPVNKMIDGLVEKAQAALKEFLTLDQVEERYIRKIIKETNKNKGEICETLGISRPTFERKLEKYGITFERD